LAAGTEGLKEEEAGGQGLGENGVYWKGPPCTTRVYLWNLAERGIWAGSAGGGGGGSVGPGSAHIYRCTSSKSKSEPLPATSSSLGWALGAGVEAGTETGVEGRAGLGAGLGAGVGGTGAGMGVSASASAGIASLHCGAVHAALRRTLCRRGDGAFRLGVASWCIPASWPCDPVPARDWVEAEVDLGSPNLRLWDYPWVGRWRRR